MIIAATALVLSTGARAQNLDEGRKMVRYERYQTAKTGLQPLAATDATANYYLGLAQLGAEDVAGARATFTKYPDDAANLAGLARIAYQEKNTADGDRLVAAITSKAKKKDYLPYLYAADAVNYGGGSPQAAVDLYKKALERADNADVRIGMADAYQKMQSGGGEAMTNYETVTGKDPKNSLAFSRIGKLWYDAHNYKLALDAFQKAKDADPSNPLPYRDLANAYYMSGAYEKAKQNIEEYLKYSDNTCDDKITYANILFLAKYYQEAQTKMQEVLGSCGERPYMYRVLGYSQYETKDYTNAMQNMRTFFSKNTDPKRIIGSDYLYMGKLYNQSKNIDSAEFYYNRALTFDTSAANRYKVYTEMAEGYKALNTDIGYNKAAEYYGKALQANPTPSAIDYFWYGAMTYYAKKYDNAGRIFMEMETKFPDQPSATYWRGRVAAAQDNEGKTGAAIPFFDQWLGKVGENYDKKNDLVTAYRYYAVYYYNKPDKAKMNEYMNKIKAINPNDDVLLQLQKLGAPGAAPKTAPKPAAGKK